MNNNDFTELKIDDIIGKIHDEVLARKPQKSVIPMQASAEHPKNYEVPPRKTGLSVRDFMNYHDDEFVRYGYRMILKREPDAKGFGYFLTALRSAQMSKCEVLGRLRYSPEGKAANVKIKGLLPRFILNSSYRIPVLGYAVQMAVLLARLPRVIKNMREHEAFTDARFTQQASTFNKTSSELNKADKEISMKITAVDNTLAESARTNTRQAGELRNAISIKADKQAVIELEKELDKKTSAQTRQIDAVKDTLKEEIASKAEKDDVNRVLEKLTFKADAGEVDEIRQELSYKAGIIDIKQVREEIAVKADIANVQEVTAEIEEKLVTNNDHIIAIKNELHNRASAKDMLALKEQIQDIFSRINESKLNIISQQKSLALLLNEASKKTLSTSKTSVEHASAPAEDEHLLDALYVSFEEMFRGSTDIIKERQKFYLQFISNIFGTEKNLGIIDLGSGRGEWLELLKETGYRAKGIDLNNVMIQQCHERGLDAEEDDILHYLQSQKQESINIITGFHIVEHLPFKTLVAVLDESFRILKRGGVVIFETPNPENIIVGSCTFYLDPSHNRPIPPDTLKFLAERRGFSRVEIHKMNPLNYVPESNDEILKHIAFRFNMSQDFSLIAVKP